MDAGGNVLDVVHVRDGVMLGLEFDETGLELVLERRGRPHATALIRRATAAGYSVAALD
ncbi:MAG: hypothetical protein ACREX8_09495 [Gammaproteobacteria bacterium]